MTNASDFRCVKGIWYALGDAIKMGWNQMGTQAKGFFVALLFGPHPGKLLYHPMRIERQSISSSQLMTRIRVEMRYTMFQAGYMTLVIAYEASYDLNKEVVVNICER
jgi:hypothetical protein